VLEVTMLINLKVSAYTRRVVSVAELRQASPFSLSNCCAKDARLLFGVNQTFAARLSGHRGATGEGNESAGAHVVELRGRVRSGERLTRGEQDQRQSCDHGFHFRSPSLV
jgi:hypothetical protein